jgi:hypothetical protein
MSDEERIDPGHSQIRGALRVIGPLIAIAGGVLTAVGFLSFATSFGDFGAPRYFWCAFLGLPMLGVGIAISRFAFMGTVARYMAGEIAPVATDTLNYVADETSGGVRTIAQAVGDGLRSGGGADAAVVVRCHKCNEENEPDANFCDNCGAALAKTKACSGCDELNDPDAEYCDACGRRFE